MKELKRRQLVLLQTGRDDDLGDVLVELEEEHTRLLNLCIRINRLAREKTKAMKQAYKQQSYPDAPLLTWVTPSLQEYHAKCGEAVGKKWSVVISLRTSDGHVTHSSTYIKGVMK